MLGVELSGYHSLTRGEQVPGFGRVTTTQVRQKSEHAYKEQQPVEATQPPQPSRLFGAEHLNQLLKPYYIAKRDFNPPPESVTWL